MFDDRIKRFFQNTGKNFFKNTIPDAFHNVVDTTKNVISTVYNDAVVIFRRLSIQLIKP